MCYIDKTEYYKCVEYDGTILYKVAVEYDLIEGNFTGKNYFENDVHDGYVPVAQFRLPKFYSEVRVSPMNPPKGDLFYLDPKCNVEPNDNDKE